VIAVAYALGFVVFALLVFWLSERSELSITMLKSRNNVKIAAAITAVARAQMRYPGANPLRVIELARKIEPHLHGYMTAEATAALCALVLKGIGVADWSDLSRLRAD
jgi:hypothetical protein